MTASRRSHRRWRAVLTALVPRGPTPADRPHWGSFVRRNWFPVLFAVIGGLGIYAGLLAQVPGGFGPVAQALAIFSAVVGAAGVYAGFVWAGSVAERAMGAMPTASGPATGVAVTIWYVGPDRPWADWLAARLAALAELDITLCQWTAGTVSGDHERHQIVILSSAPRRCGLDPAALAEPPFSHGRLLVLRVETDEAVLLPPAVVAVDLASGSEPDAFDAVLQGLLGIGLITHHQAAHGRAVGHGAIRFPGSGAALSNVPPSVSRFIGREHELDELYRAFFVEQGRKRSRVCEIWGFPGVGKTTLAKEFVDRFGGLFAIAWWISAELDAGVDGDLRELASRLGIPDTPPALVLERLWQALEHRSDWLLIFDNVEALDQVAATWPARPDGHILVTSRYRPRSDAVDRTLHLVTLSRTESVKLLLARTGSTDTGDAAAIADYLGDLPLALDQAASYVEESGRSLPYYMDLLRSHPESLGHVPPDRHQQAVADTLTLSLAAVTQQAPAATHFMRFFALTNSDDLPRGLLSANAAALPAALSAVVADPIRYDDLIGILSGFSLIDATDDRLDVHRLVQVTILTTLSVAERLLWVGAVVRFLSRAFPREVTDSRVWALCDRLLPHLITVTEHVRQCPSATGEITRELSGLLHLAGIFLLRQSSYQRSRTVIERCIAFRESIPDSPEMAETLSSYGELLYRLAELPAAADALTRALEIQQAATPTPDAEALVHTLLWLAQVRRERSELAESMAAATRAREVAVAAMGEDALQLAEIDEVLGMILWRQGRLWPAVARLRAAVALREARPDTDPALTAVALRHLGLVQCELAGALGSPALADSALDSLRRALAIVADAYGPQHFETAGVQHWMAAALAISGDLPSAQRFAQGSYDVHRRILGEDHPSTVAASLVLAYVLRLRGNLAEAKVHADRAREIYVRTYFDGHPYVAEADAEVGALAVAQGDADLARRTLASAVAIVSAANADHPKLIGLFDTLAGATDDEEERQSYRSAAARIRAAVDAESD